jgi:uncharacterized ferritin-like protein (DUF455 family)
MKISEYAKHLLLSESIEDKLLPPSTTWEEEGDLLPLRIEKPIRSKQLQFSDKKSKIPRLEHLNQISARGLTLHHFANHELMAIELFAWALLAFPDVSRSIRMGFLKTIAEEQTHLRMYLERMHSFGIGFGDIPVNYLFWKQTYRMTTVERFSAILSLTFEGANLDYSQIYAQAFLYHGDVETAEIMIRIFEDEVKHVKRGVQILKKSIPTEQTDWDQYRSLIDYPFTPRRAKGYFYFGETRRMSGLSEHFVNGLDSYRDEYTDRINLNGLGQIKIKDRILRKTDLQNPNLYLQML